MFTKYDKFIIAVLGVLIAILTRHYGSGSEAVQDLELVLTALGVYATPNKTIS